MKPDLWPRVRELFERAMDRSAADAAALVHAEAGDDAAVREEVLSLLRHHRAAGAFLDEPATARTDLLGRDAPFGPGHVLGPYTIVREAGRGGMGRVYVATDARLGRTVALKAIRPQIGNQEEQRARLRREARAAAALAHPGICTVYALEEFEGDLFVVSEFVDGRTLREEMTDETRPKDGDVLRTAVEIASALACAHDAGITHRDLKPENVMRARDGRLKILDFGLARIAAPSPGGEGLTVPDTRPGGAWGTPGYMAPEQLNGRAADARSDVFAFGVMLYEYACGVHPFDAPTPLAMAARVLEGAAQPIGAVRPDLSAAVGAAVDRCLQKSPGDRFASATDLLRGLERGSPAGRPPLTAWWRLHQLLVMAVYLVASGIGWQAKEAAEGGAALSAFLAIGIASTIGAVFRAHLLFTEHVNIQGLRDERRRAAPVTFIIDAAIALILTFDGRAFVPRAPLAAVLTIALGVCLLLARLILEPSTTRAAFGDG